jgi:hypothetical protein
MPPTFDCGGAIVDEPFMILLDDTMSRLACLVSLAGALCIRLFGGQLAWALVAFGLILAWLAHQFAIAPLLYESALSVPRRGRMGAPEGVGQD